MSRPKRGSEREGDRGGVGVGIRVQHVFFLPGNDWAAWCRVVFDVLQW